MLTMHRRCCHLAVFQALCEEYKIQASHGLEHALRVLEHADKASLVQRLSVLFHTFICPRASEDNKVAAVRVIFSELSSSAGWLKLSF